jgi:Uma2 family endonuclease
MATVLSPPERNVILGDVSWETYERLLADFADQSAPRLAYDRGVLQIMSPLPEHEEYNRTIALLVEVVAEEWNLDVRNLGSTTFKRADLAQGFEPDSCFYIQNAGAISGKTQIDLLVDPPPDLVIEIDITHPSLDKFPIYARVGVPEIWRYDGRRFAILALEGGSYGERDEGVALPGLDRKTLERLVEDSRSLRRTAWLRTVRDWARGHGGTGSRRS